MHLQDIDAMDQLIERVRAALSGLAPAPASIDAPGGRPGPGSAGIDTLSGAEVARWIDHTLLDSGATAGQIETLCREADRLACAAVCVQPVRVAEAVAHLRDSPVAVATVVGFPMGVTTTRNKAAEAAELAALGASELDMVINRGWLLEGRNEAVLQDIRAVVDAAGEAHVKVILETGALEDDAVVRAALLSRAAGAAFVKTSTGLMSGGATTHAVALLRLAVGPAMGVKAAGGIRDLASARAMLAAGADRLGCSATLAIVAES